MIFPIQETANDSLSPAKAQGEIEPKPGQYDVFLVEDNEDDREQILKTLERSPYIHQVLSFSSGDGFMSFLKTEGYHAGTKVITTPALIFLDLHMPGTDGIEILRELREHPVTKNIPVVITTGDLSEKQVIEAYRLQANAYIYKPVRLGNLHELIYNGWDWPLQSDPTQSRARIA